MAIDQKTSDSQVPAIKIANKHEQYRMNWQAAEIVSRTMNGEEGRVGTLVQAPFCQGPDIAGAARSSHTRPDPRYLTASLLAPISLFQSPSCLFDPQPAPRRHQERTPYTKLTNHHQLQSTSMSRNSVFDPPSEAAETGSSLCAAVSGLNKVHKAAK